MPEGQIRRGVELTDAQKAFEAKIDSMFGRLAEAGWISGGGCDLTTFHIGLGCNFDPGIKMLRSDDVLPKLPVKDGGGRFLPGFEVDDDPDTGTVYLGYEGPFDETFERVVDALVAVGNGNMESLTELDGEIGRLALSRDTGYFDKAVALHHEQGIGDVGDGEILLTARKLVRDDLYVWRNAVYDLEDDSEEG